MGTRHGCVLLFDETGKQARPLLPWHGPAPHGPDTAQLRALPPHGAAVTDISFDSTGAYVATASDDGTVAVRPLSFEEAAAASLTAPAPQVASVSGVEHAVHTYTMAVKARAARGSAAASR